MLLPRACLQHMGFLALCVLLTVPECTKGCRSTEHRTLHSINARTAFYTISVGALVKSCAKMLDCTQQPDGSYSLDALPDLPCWEFDDNEVSQVPYKLGE